MSRSYVRALREKLFGFRPDRRVQPRRQSPLAVERLEDRTVPSASLSLSGPQTLVAGSNINVSNNTATTESEMVIDVNPTNPLNVAGFVHDGSNLNQIQVFYSTDGGTTWARTLITNGGGAGSSDDGLAAGKRFDPAVKFDANGNLFVAYGFDDGTTTQLVVARSTDGGKTFTQFTTVDQQNDIPPAPGSSPGDDDDGGAGAGSPGLDKWQLATGPDGTGTGTQAVYVAYSQTQAVPVRVTVAGSHDGGATFTAPRIIDDANDTGTSQFAIPAVGPGGELYVAWDDATLGQILIDRDLDGLWQGASQFGTDTVVRNCNRFMQKFAVPAQPNRGIPTGPVLDVDRSGGQFNGRLYLAFTDGFGSPTPPEDTDVFLVSSSDRGAHWTTFDASSPGNVEGASSTDFLPWVAVDQNTGSINVAYYTTDGTPSNQEVNLRLASSVDGGVTFTKVNLSSATSEAAAAGYSGDFLEYIGLAVLDGTAHGFWADNRKDATGNYVNDLDAYSARASFLGDNTLTIRGDDFGITDDTITLLVDPANPLFLKVVVTSRKPFGGPVLANNQIQFEGLISSIRHIQVFPGEGTNTVNIADLPRGIDLSIQDRGPGTIIIGSNHTMADILGTITITNPSLYTDRLIVDDSADRGDNTNVTLSADAQQSHLTGLGRGRLDFDWSAINAFTVNSGSGHNVFTVRSTPTAYSTLLKMGGDDQIFVGYQGEVQGIQGTLNIENPPSFNDITVDDSADSANTTVTLRTLGSNPADSESNSDPWGQISGLSQGNINYEYGDTNSLTLKTGVGFVTLDVLATGTITNLIATTPTDGSGPTTDTIVNVGDAGQVQGIQGTLNIENPAFYNDITVDDSADTANPTVTLRTLGSNPADSESNSDPWGQISGLSQGNINYEYGDTKSLTLKTGVGFVTLDVLATGTATNLIATAPADGSGPTTDTIVNVGDAGQVQGIQGTLNIENPAFYNDITVDDSADTANPTVTLRTLGSNPADSESNSDPWGQISGLSQGNINYEYGDTNSLTLKTGVGFVTVDVLATGTTTNLIATAPTDGSGPTTDTIVNVGDAGRVQGIEGTLNIENPAFYNDITVDDSADTANPTVTLRTLGSNPADSEGNSDPWGQISGLSQGNINYEYGDTASLTVHTGNVSGSIVNIEATGTITNLINHASATVNIGSDPVNLSQSTLDAIQGAVTVHGQGATATLNVHDDGTLTSQDYGVYANSIHRFNVASPFADNIAAIGYQQIANLNLYLGQAQSGDNQDAVRNIADVFSTGPGTTTTINGGSGRNNVTVAPFDAQPGLPLDNTGIQGAVYVHGGGNPYDTVSYYDFLNPKPQTYTMTATQITDSGFAAVTFDDNVHYAGLYTSMQGYSTVNLLGTAGTTYSTGVQAEAGDTVNIGSDPVNLSQSILDPIQGPVAVNSVGGTTLTVNDQGAATRQNWDVGNTWIDRYPVGGSRPAVPQITYHDLATVAVNTGTGGAVIGVSSTALGTTTIVNGNAGGLDQFLVENITNMIDDIQGPLQIHDVAPSNLEVIDQGNTVGHSYTVTTGEVQRDGIQPITYDHMAELILAAANNPFFGHSPNTVNVQSLGGDVFAPILVGTGDTVNIGQGGTMANILGDIRIQGLVGQPPRQVTVDDSTDSSPHTIGLASDPLFGYLVSGLLPPSSLGLGRIGFLLDQATPVTIKAGTGTDVLQVNNLTGAPTLTLDGGAGTNTLQGPNTANTWRITGPNGGSLNQALTFSSMQNLTGGSFSDDFDFQTGGSLAGKLDGGAGANKLDYSAFLGDVTVDLPLSVATAVAQGIAGIQNVTGSQGNDILVGDANVNVFKGGTGRNLIIGGAGADTLTGGGGDNILIGGTTAYDATLSGLQALQAILHEFLQTYDPDPFTDFTIRTDNIRKGTGTLTNSGVHLDKAKGKTAATVFGDGAQDALISGGGFNWFLYDSADIRNSTNPNDKPTKVD